MAAVGEGIEVEGHMVGQPMEEDAEDSGQGEHITTPTNEVYLKG